MDDTLAEIISAQTNADLAYHVVKLIIWHAPTLELQNRVGCQRER